MSAFDRLLNTTVTIWRTSDSGSLDSEGDDYGKAAQATTEVATVAARIEPKMSPMGTQGGVQEPLSTWEGTSVNDSTVFMRIADVTAFDSLTDADGNAYKILQVRDAAGQVHHYEIDVRKIDPEPAEAS